MQYSENGLNLTKSFEGCKLTAYADQGGVWTVGYGHTGPDVRAGLVITASQADAFLRSDIATAVHHVNALVTVPLTQNQFDSLVDFTFNLGTRALQDSLLLKCVNAGRNELVPTQFMRWNHIGAVENAGLTRRRKAEADLWSKG